MSGPPARRTRIVHVIQNMNYGGMERMLSDLIRLTDPVRFELHLVVLHYLGRFAEGLERHATLHRTPPLGRASMIWPGALIRQLRDLAPDVVHLHSGVWFKGARAAHLARVPAVVYTDHGRPSPDLQPGRFIDGIASRWTTRIVAVSEALRDQLAATIVHDPARLQLIANGIDIAAYSAARNRLAPSAELGLPAGAPVIGSVGRLEPIKGYDVMLEAFGLLRNGWREGPPPHLVVVGEGSLRARLQRRAGELGVSDAVHLLGWRDDVPDWLAGFDLFTLASRSEGTSISLLEAMAAGRCPVVTDVGGNRAVLGEALAHRLVAAENPERLAHAWRTALADPAHLAADAAEALARVTARYSAHSMVRSYEALYDELAGKG